MIKNINACIIRLKVDVNNVSLQFCIMFKYFYITRSQVIFYKRKTILLLRKNNDCMWILFFIKEKTKLNENKINENLQIEMNEKKNDL